MYITTKQAHLFFGSVKLHKNVKIYSAYDVISILATDILATILEKECIRYELFISEKINVNDTENIDGLKIYINHYPNNDVNGVFIGVAAKKKLQKHKSIQQKNADNCVLWNKTAINEDEIYVFDGNSIPNKLSTEKCFFACEYNSCKCCDDAYSILTLFSLIKILNYLENKTLWPILVYFSYRDVFCKKNTECEVCNAILTELKYELEKNEINNVESRYLEDNQDHPRKSTDVLVYRKDINIPYLFSSNLYLTLNSDITFLVQKKIFSKIKPEVKLNEFLAKSGISIQVARESFTNLCRKYKDLIYDVLPQSFVFSKKYDNDVKMTGIECYYLMLSYLFYGEPYLCIQLLHNKSYYNINKILQTNKCDYIQKHPYYSCEDVHVIGPDSNKYLSTIFTKDNNDKHVDICNPMAGNIYFMLIQAFKENVRNVKQANNIKILYLKTTTRNLVFVEGLHDIFILFFNLLHISSGFFILIENFHEKKTLIYGKKEKNKKINGKTIDKKGFARLVSKKHTNAFIKQCLKI